MMNGSATTNAPRAAQQDVEAGRLGRVVTIVPKIGFVDDLGYLPQDRVVELVAAQERLEGAIAAMVGELRAAHVEERRTGRQLVRVIHERELSLGVDEASNQPSAGRTIDVAVLTRRPLHPTGSSTRAASSSTACCATSRSAGGK